MDEPKAIGEIWTCPHGFVTGFFRVPGKPFLVEHRSCGICCDEISEKLCAPIRNVGDELGDILSDALKK